MFGRVQGQLIVSRAFGDIDYKDWVIAEPEGHTQQLTKEDDLLILASDGIYSIFKNDYIVQRILKLREKGLQYGQIAETIVNEAKEMRCKDNVTLMIISLSHYLSEYQSFTQQ